MSKLKTITPNPPADFTPPINTTRINSFRAWCQSVMPLVYDNSLSYYELLCKVIDYLNKIIENANDLNIDIENLQKSFILLQDYVNNYFESLDVQEEINNKLDQMAADGTLSDLIHNDFLDYKFTTINYNGTTIYYCILPNSLKLNLAIAGDKLGVVDTPSSLSNHERATLMINAGIFDINSSLVRGYLIRDGVTYSNEQLNPEQYKDYELLYYKDGLLSSLSASTPIETVEALNADFVLQGFYTFVQNGQFTGTKRDPNDFQPRTWIAQNKNNILLGVCDGRLPVEKGLSIRNMYDFMISIGFIPNFAYNLDGGGSCAAIDHGIKINKYIDQKNRKIPTALYFKKERTLNNNTFVINDIIAYQLERGIRQQPQVYNNPIQQYSFSSEIVGTELYRVDTSTSNYVYNRICKYAYDLTNNEFFIDALNNESYRNIFKILSNGDFSVFNSTIGRFNSPLKTPQSYNINDLNNLDQSGFYWCNPATTANTPSSNSGVCIYASGGYNIMIFIEASGALYVKQKQLTRWTYLPQIRPIAEYNITPPTGALAYTTNNKLMFYNGTKWYYTDGTPYN